MPREKDAAAFRHLHTTLAVKQAGLGRVRDRNGKLLAAGSPASQLVDMYIESQLSVVAAALAAVAQRKRTFDENC